MNTKLVRVWMRSVTVCFNVWDWIYSKDASQQILSRGRYFNRETPIKSLTGFQKHDMPRYCDQTRYTTEQRNLNAVREQTDFQLLLAAGYYSIFQSVGNPFK